MCVCVCLSAEIGRIDNFVCVYLLCYGTISRAILMVFNACLSLHIVIIEIVVLCHTVFFCVVSFAVVFIKCFVSNEIIASYFIRYPMIWSVLHSLEWKKKSVHTQKGRKNTHPSHSYQRDNSNRAHDSTLWPKRTHSVRSSFFFWWNCKIRYQLRDYMPFKHQISWATICLFCSNFVFRKLLHMCVFFSVIGIGRRFFFFHSSCVKHRIIWI